MAVYFAETTAADQRQLLCRWTERFYMEKKRVQVLAESMASAQLIDQLLWTFSQSSFIPHLTYNLTGETPSEPVLITTAETRIDDFKALICEYSVGVEFMREFETAVHFVFKDDPERTRSSRNLWQEARDGGLNPVHVPYSAGADKF